MRKITQCINCGQDTRNAKFCSRSCASTHNNRLFPKKAAVIHLCACGQPKSVKSRKYCKSCFNNNHLGKNKTIGELLGKGANRYNLIRHRARNSVKNNPAFQSCCRCPYDKHVEIAHKVPICEFSLDTLVSIVNHESNLMPLCPNCHWENDNL